jgi:hypothetical protein
MPKALLETLRAFSKREGIGYQVLLKRWLDDRLRLERDRLRASKSERGETANWRITPGRTAPVLDPEGARVAAFIHVSVQNLTAFAPRVRGWVTFCDQQGRNVCGGEMPIRWSIKPEPLMLYPLLTSPSTVELRWVPNPALMPDGYLTDFAEKEEQEFAFAIKMKDATCWGWTQESYLHGWRHPKWKLPPGKLQAHVRILAGGREHRANFELDTEESVDSIVVRGAAGRVGTQGSAADAHQSLETLPPNVIRLPPKR